MSDTDREHRPVPICALGASAGGLAALREFFRRVPDDLGLAYVVIVHLSPEHPSIMDELLAMCTKMPVKQVEDGPELLPDCVYVIAPGSELVIEDDVLKARPFTEKRSKRAPIDMFFRSVAAARGDGVAFVLSGGGSDGAVGVKAMKEAGGVIFVQEPADAEFPMMPRSAIATGSADLVGPISDLTDNLIDVARSKEAVRALNADDAADQLRRIIALLRNRTGHDFSSYKRATVMRRVKRRMQVRRQRTLEDYGAILHSEPEEARALFDDLLISVTNFFRDEEAWKVLAGQGIAPLFEDPPEEGIRAWVAGCATGEEAYSLAILFLEEAERRQVKVPIQIFATDLDEGALRVGREGCYPRAIEADVSQERLQRFFVRDGSRYRVRTEVRDMVLFASHSVLKDPPFMRLDLLTCRNVLIYLDRQLQQHLFSVFHYGLRQGGFLFLGSAETADAAPNLFTPIDRERRLYRMRPQQGTRPLPVLSMPVYERVERAAEGDHAEVRRERPESGRGAHIDALERGAPPSVLVDDQYDILYLSPDAGRFIRPSGGAFSGKLPAVVHPELRLDLAAALARAFERKEPSLTARTSVTLDGQRRSLMLSVTPLAPSVHNAPQALILFLQDGSAPEEPEDESPDAPDELRRLHGELKASNEALLKTRGDHERAIEELRAANEELQSINEEYRSTSEELETSKEELQSMNEELQTVNAELKRKLEAVSSAHSDLRNLTAATEVGTLFLDRKLRIRMLTPPVSSLFNITDLDIGRPLTNFTHNLRYGRIEQDARRVLEKLSPVEAEVQTTDGAWYMMRLTPYRSMEDRIEGVVLSFVDISSRVEAEEQLRRSENRFRTLFESMDEGVLVGQVIRDEEGRAVDIAYLEANPMAGRLVQADYLGKRISEIAPDFEPHWWEVPGRVAASGVSERLTLFAKPLDAWFEVGVFPLEDDRVSILFQDVTEAVKSREERELLTRELSHRVKNTLAVVLVIAQQTRSEDVEAFKESFTGRVRALAEAHGLLVETDWQDTALVALVTQALAPYRRGEGRRIEVEGEDTALTPKQALSLALVLHELGTNALKYGALSDDGGSIAVRWQIETHDDGRRWLSLLWEERGGPPVEPPERHGFGSDLIEGACTYDLKGRVKMDFAPKGLSCHLEFPLSGEEEQ